MTDAYWWVTPTVTVASIYVSAKMITWQQKASKANELKFKLFDELRGGLDEVSSALTNSGITAFSMPGAVRLYRDAKASGQFAAVPNYRIPVFNDAHAAGTAKLVKLIGLLESYEIVSEHFHLFRRALGCAHADVLQSFNNLNPALYTALPIDLPGRGDPIVPSTTPAQFESFSQLCNAYWQSTHTANSYVHDIRIEAQNVLLGGLFKRRVPPREPADPRLWVLRTDDADYLERVTKYFTEEHPAAAKGNAMKADAFDTALQEMVTDK